MEKNKNLIKKRTQPVRIHWRLSAILKSTNKSVWNNAFWYVKECISWKCILYTIHWDKTQTLKRFPSCKIKGTKNAFYFISRAPIHQNFTFNLQFLYELKHKVRRSSSLQKVRRSSSLQKVRRSSSLQNCV